MHKLDNLANITALTFPMCLFRCMTGAAAHPVDMRTSCSYRRRVETCSIPSH